MSLSESCQCQLDAPQTGPPKLQHTETVLSSVASPHPPCSAKHKETLSPSRLTLTTRLFFLAVTTCRAGYWHSELPKQPELDLLRPSFNTALPFCYSRKSIWHSPLWLVKFPSWLVTMKFSYVAQGISAWKGLRERLKVFVFSCNMNLQCLHRLTLSQYTVTQPGSTMSSMKLNGNL